MPYVSIIVPIYNAEASLQKCVESIIRQTYDKWELLLVDDGSTDGTSRICETFTNEDSRIQYYYKKNEGVSSARNYGIERVNSPRIVFVDSDDSVDPVWLENLVADDSVDLSVAGYAFHEGESVIRKVPGMVDSVPSLIGELGSMHDLGCVCRFSFKTSIIQENHIRFNERYFVLEDECFLSHYLRYTNSVRVKSTCDYHSPLRNYEEKYHGKWNDDVYFEIADNIFCCLDNYECGSIDLRKKMNDVRRHYLSAMYNSFIREIGKKNGKAEYYYKELMEYSRFWTIYPKLLLFRFWARIYINCNLFFSNL